MLHIKLPKGKVSSACERAAEQCSRRIAVENDWYLCALETWRKSGGDLTEPRQAHFNPPPIRSNDVELLVKERSTLHRMADMCKHSTGDVYVSPELWNIIKGVY